MKAHWVMDYETLSDCFIAVFEHYRTEETHIFVVSPLQNDFDPFIAFLERNIRQKEWHISFNGLAFDAQITQYIWLHRNRLKEMSPEKIAKTIYAEAQATIARQNARDSFPRYRENQLFIKQLDLFTLNHWNNPAKRASLKWIQCSIRWFNIKDMPFSHTEKVEDFDTLSQIIEYCRNDVSSTKEVMKISKKQIELRLSLSSTYNLNLNSASEPKIVRELFLQFLSEKTKIPKWELKNLRTYRAKIKIDKLILPYVKFTTPEFNKLLLSFRKLNLDALGLKGQFKFSVNYRGVTTDFGLGGVHGAKRGIFESNEHMVIKTADVQSYYPNLAIRNKWAPAHLPQKEFSELYEWFFDERTKISKKDLRNYVYKIILNSTYGLSNEINSFLYDPEFTMRITINGQLSLMMLYEKIIETIPGAIPLMQNTDGVEIMIPRRYEEEYQKICTEWENLTQLKLEHDHYRKLMIPDVNNYIGIFEAVELSKEDFMRESEENPYYLFEIIDGKFFMSKTKAKGRFEIDKALHKNHSFMVIQKAVYYYYVYGVEPEDYLKQNRDILDYCGMKRAVGTWTFSKTFIQEGKVITEDLQKTLRYYISKSGDKLVKRNKTDNRLSMVHAEEQCNQKIFNLKVDKPFEEYDLDLSFYLKKIKERIQELEPQKYSSQYTLF